jgi:sulfate permease, SulP family
VSSFYMNKIIPAFNWILKYKRTDFSSDFSAGLIVAIMLIPQGMAYAMLAGLPPVIGLYASTIPLMIYALFGSSRQLAVGPVAIISMMVAAAVSQLASPGTGEYIGIVLLLALLSGAIQLLLGLFRLGFVMNFMSHVVISGFTSAAAIIIGFSQLKTLLGIPLQSDATIFHLLIDAATRMGEIHWPTFSMGIISVLVLIFFKKKVKKFPAPLIVVVMSTLLVYWFRLDQYGVKIIGNIPKGIPTFSFPELNLEVIITLLPIALTISFVGVMESVAVAKAIATKEKYKIDANQEFIGLGLANLSTSLFSGYPVTGGFSRTAVNYQAGARTPLASIMTSVLVFITLLFFTPLFYFLPNVVLSSIIIVAVIGLIDIKEVKYLFSIRRIDGWTLMVTFLSTLLIGVEEGVIIGIVFSLLVFIWRSAHPHIVELGYLENQKVFKNIKRFPEGKTYKETMILRIDASLYFANMEFLENYLCIKVAEKPGIKNIILDFSGVNEMDTVAIHSMEEIINNGKKHGSQFYFSAIKEPIRDLLARAGWEEKYGERIAYLSIEEALKNLK